jgi:uncharacterized protein involved in exopolysaccharide biosynthesis
MGTTLLASQDAASPADHSVDPTDLRAIARILVEHKFIAAAFALAGALIAGVLAFVAEPVYRAEIVVTEVRDKGMTSVAQTFARQLGGLASLAGINVAPDAGPGQEAQALLSSRRLAEEFVTRENLLPILAKKSGKPDTLWKTVEGFRTGVVVISQDRRNGVTTVAMEWTDAALAAQWANGYVALANDLLRGHALEEASRNINYLNEQIAKTNVVELQRVMYNLVQNEMQSLMLASARKEYAFTIIDPAVAPERKVRPNRRVMVATGAALGLLLGTAVAFALNAYQRRRGLVSRGSRPTTA